VLKYQSIYHVKDSLFFGITSCYY